MFLLHYRRHLPRSERRTERKPPNPKTQTLQSIILVRRPHCWWSASLEFALELHSPHRSLAEKNDNMHILLCHKSQPYHRKQYYYKNNEWRFSCNTAIHTLEQLFPGEGLLLAWIIYLPHPLPPPPPKKKRTKYSIWIDHYSFEGHLLSMWRHQLQARNRTY